MLANGVGVCDETYRGEYMIPFRKMKDNPTPIELPCKLAQLNLQKRETCVFRLVDELDDTIRGSGGFGSTGS
jgi:dUTP pyrophosphatase